MTVVNEARAERRDAARRKRKGAPDDTAWRGFVQCELSDLDKQHVRELLAAGETAWEYLLALVVEGYKLTLSFDYSNSSWVASLTCKRSSDPNVGLTLTARGGTVVGAMVALFYKDDAVLKREWAGRAAVDSRRFSETDVG